MTMSSAKKTRMRVTGSDIGGSPNSAELITPRRSSRTRKSTEPKGLPDNITPTPASQRKRKTSLPNGNVTKTPDVSLSQARRSARLQNSITDNVGSPKLSSAGSRRSRLKKDNSTATPEVQKLNPKGSSGRRRSSRGSQRQSPKVTYEPNNTPCNTRLVKGKRKLSQRQGDVEKSAPGNAHTDSNEHVAVDTTAEERHGGGDTEHCSNSQNLSDNIENKRSRKLPHEDAVPKKRRKSSESDNVAIVSSTDSHSGALKMCPESKSKEEIMDIGSPDDREISSSNCELSQVTKQNTDAATSKETSQQEAQDGVSSSQAIVAEPKANTAEVFFSNPPADSTEEIGHIENLENAHSIHELPSGSLHCSAKSDDDRTDPIDALVRDLAEKQSDDLEKGTKERNDKRKDTRRRSSFIRGRLSQAAVALEESDLSNCIPFEFPAEQRLEMLVQKVARHTLDRLTEEFTEVEEDNHFVTNALESIEGEIGKLKEDKEFSLATNKNSFLPHPENIALENRIKSIQRTINRSNAESEEWDKVIAKYASAAENAKVESEKDQLLVADRPGSGAVQRNIEVLRKTKLQFVTVMDRLRNIQKAVDNYNANTAATIEKVVQENGVKLLGDNEKVDPLKLIQSLPITDHKVSSQI